MNVTTDSNGALTNPTPGQFKSNNAIGSGDGDVTQAGDNTFTGNNTFTLPITAADISTNSIVNAGGFSSDSAVITTDGSGNLTVGGFISFGFNTLGATSVTSLNGAILGDWTTLGDNDTYILRDSGSGAVPILLSDTFQSGDFNATTSGNGVITLATSAEVIAGTDAAKAVTSAAGAAAYVRKGTGYNTIASGTAYTLTGSFANVAMGTTSPITPPLAAGDYLLTVDVSSALVGATTVAGQAVNIILRRTNNTAANIGTQRQQPLPLVTLTSGVGPSVSIASFPYTASAGDIVTVQASLTGTLGAGSVTINAAHIVAMPR